jgi:hypothetical protein
MSKTELFIWNKIILHGEALGTFVTGWLVMAKPSLIVVPLRQSQKSNFTSNAAFKQMEFLTQMFGLSTMVFGMCLYMLGETANKTQRKNVLRFLLSGDIAHLGILYGLDGLSTSFSIGQGLISLSLCGIRILALFS